MCERGHHIELINLNPHKSSHCWEENIQLWGGESNIKNDYYSILKDIRKIEYPK